MAASNRAVDRPRAAASPAVAKAMNPRIEGTDAAVAAPSRIRVPPSTSRFVVKAVMTAAMPPNTGPNRSTRRWPSRSDSTPNSGEPTSSLA